MTLDSYHPRIVDEELVRRLGDAGAVVIEGPKTCGKTVSARQIAASEVLLDIDENARRAMALDPSLVLQGAAPRLIDEWQIEPSIWNIRRAVDDRGRPGQFARGKEYTTRRQNSRSERGSVGEGHLVSARDRARPRDRRLDCGGST